jgi:DNA-binding transcriptional ArsR family regulator
MFKKEGGPAGSGMRTLVLAALTSLLLAPLAVGQEASPLAEVHLFKGTLRCGASVGGAPAANACPWDSEESPLFKIVLPPGVYAVVLEVQWTPSTTTGSQWLRFDLAPAVDQRKTSHWETGPGAVLRLDPLREDVIREGGTLRIEARPPQDAAPAAFVADQPFLVTITVLSMPPPMPVDAAPPAAALPPAGTAPASGGGDQAWLVPWTLAAAAASIGAVAAAPRLRRLCVLLLTPLFTRLDEDRVLSHPRRALLLSLVRAQPGLGAESARRRLGLAHGVFDHHLRVLLGHGLVRRQDLEGHVLLYPANVRQAPSAEAPLAARLLAAVRDEPGLRQVDLARRLQVSEGTLRYHATWLGRKGRLQLVTDGRSVRCYPA